MNIKYANSLTLAKFNQDPFQVGVANWSGATYSEQYLSSYVTELGTTYHINNNYNFEVDYFNEDKTSEFASGWGSNYEHKSINTKFNVKKDNYKVSIGLNNFEAERIGDDDTTTKDNLGYFISSEYNIDNSLKLSLGARQEKIKYEYDPISGIPLNDKESLNAYDVGLNYQLNENNSFFINYNRSFQSPDIDRFFSGGFSGAPKIFNNFIQPAKVKTINLGYNNFSKDNKLKVAIFRNNLENEIYYNKATSKNTNIDKSHKYGLEIFDKYNINENIYTSVNYNYIIAKIDNENDFDGSELPGVSKHNIKLNLGWQDDKFSSILTHSYRSKAYSSNDFSNNSKQKQKSYNSTDLVLNYKYSSFDFFAKVENLFNKKNAILVDDDKIYPVNFERAFYAGIKYSF
jgi:iron complex outermembrane receptor protein